MRFKLILAIGFSIGIFTVGAMGQTDSVAANSAQDKPKAPAAAPVNKPATTEIRGITLGMTADEVKDKLGKPKVNDKDGFYYLFSDTESLQIRLDGDRKVNIISMIYSGNDGKAPQITEVLGDSAVTAPDAKGRIYKMVRYPDAGYWVSYSKTLQDSGPMISVTMRKIR